MQFCLSSSLTVDLRNWIDTKVLCQRRTSKNKQFVFIENDDNIVKGPFSQDRIDTILFRRRKLIEWNSNHIVLPNDEIRVDSRNGHSKYLTFPNKIPRGTPLETEINQESFSSYKYRILKRTNLIKISDAQKKKAFDYSNSVGTLLYDLILCYILEIGDVYFANILVDVTVVPCKIYIVDIDETRGVPETEGTEIFYFTKHNAKEDRWLTLVRPYYSSIIDKLKILYESEESITLKTRMNNAISLLSQSNIVPKPRLRIVSDTGLMVFKGRFGSKTVSGFDVDVAKSALQKYIRRGIVDKAVQVGVELYRMCEVEGGKAIQSNFYNRLAIIAIEDIGPANLPLAIKVLQMVIEDKRDLPETLALIQLMCGSEKSRIVDHIYYVYGTKEGREKAALKGLVIGEMVPEHLDSSYNWKSGDPEEIKELGNTFEHYLRKKDMSSVYWAYRYMCVAEELKLKVVSRNRRTVPIAALWDIMKPYLIPNTLTSYGADVWESLSQTSYNSSEKFLFLYMGIYCIVKSVPYYPLGIKEHIETWRKSEILPVLMQRGYKLELDSYVYDMHTAQGKIMGANRTTFVTEGARVENQSMVHFDQQLLDIYNS